MLETSSRGGRTHVPRSREPVKSGAVEHVTTVNGAPRRRDRGAQPNGSVPRQREPERRALRVTTHRPGLPGVDHAAAQPTDPLQRERHVGHREIRQRCRVSRPGAARVDPDRGPLTAGLTPGALPLEALLEAVVEQPFPEAARPLGVIGGELDQRQPRAGHRPKLPLHRAEPAHVQTGQGWTRAAPRRPRHAALVVTMPGGERRPSDDTAAMITSGPPRRPAYRRGAHAATAPRLDARAARPGRLNAVRGLGQRPLCRRRAGARGAARPFEGRVDGGVVMAVASVAIVRAMCDAAAAEKKRDPATVSRTGTELRWLNRPPRSARPRARREWQWSRRRRHDNRAGAAFSILADWQGSRHE